MPSGFSVDVPAGNAFCPAKQFSASLFHSGRI